MAEYTDKEYTIVENKYFKLLLTAEEFSIITVLLKYKNSPRGINPSYEQIRDKIIIHQGSINKAIRALEYANLIEVEVKRTIQGKAQNYFKIIDFPKDDAIIELKRMRLEFMRDKLHDKYKKWTKTIQLNATEDEFFELCGRIKKEADETKIYLVGQDVLKKKLILRFPDDGATGAWISENLDLSTYPQDINNVQDQTVIRYRIKRRSDTGSDGDLSKSKNENKKLKEKAVDLKRTEIVDNSPISPGSKEAPDAPCPSSGWEPVSKLLRYIFKATEVS